MGLALNIAKGILFKENENGFWLDNLEENITNGC